MGDATVSLRPADQGKQLARCSGCGRTPRRGKTVCFYCDPSVPESEKQAALQLGGRRGALTPSEVARLLEGADLDTREGRQQLRDRFLRLRLAGRLGTGVYRDVLVAVDGAAKDQERSAAPKPKTAPIVVEVVGNGAHS